MTQLLEKALEQVRELKPEAQEANAAIILDELGDNQEWDKQLARTQTQLRSVADKVRDDIRAAECTRLRRCMGTLPDSDPLILGTWWDTPALSKTLRLREHLEWADGHGKIEEVNEFFVNAPEDDRLHRRVATVIDAGSNLLGPLLT